MQQVRNNLKWVDGKAVKNEFEIQILDMLGPKNGDDTAPVPKQAKQKERKTKRSGVANEGESHVARY